MTHFKSLAEIAFDAYQCFAPLARKYPPWQNLYSSELDLWERVAERVKAEVLLRQEEERS